MSLAVITGDAFDARPTVEFALQPDEMDPSEGPKSKEAKILRKVKRLLQSSRKRCDEHHRRHQENEDFASPLASQWDKKILEIRGDRPSLSMDDVGVAIRALSGREITARVSAKAQASDMDGGDDAVAKLDDELLRFARRTGKLEHAVSESHRCVLVGGLGFRKIHCRENRNGRIASWEGEPIPIREAYWDTSARQINMRDREFGAWARWIGRGKAKRLYPDPDQKKKIEKVKQNTETIMGRAKLSPDDTTSIKGWAYYDAKPTGLPYRPARDDIFLVEIEWREVETRYLLDVSLADPSLVEFLADRIQPQDPRVELEEEEWEALEAERDAGNLTIPDHAVSEVYYDRIRYAILAGSEVLAHGRRAENRWTILPHTAWAHEQSDGTVSWYGCVDIMKEPQKFANMLASLAVESVAFGFKNLKLFNAESLTPESKQNLASIATRPDGLLLVNGDVNAAAKELSTHGVPANVQELRMESKNDVLSRVGLNAYSVGNPGDLRRVASSSIERTHQSSVAVIARIFDSLDETVREEAETILGQIVYLRGTDLAEIVGPTLAALIPAGGDGAQLSYEALRDALTRNMDIALTKAPLTPTAREEAFERLNTVLPTILGIPGMAPPPHILVKMMPDSLVDPTDRAEWAKSAGTGQGVLDRLAMLEQQLAQLTGQPAPTQEQ